MIKIKVTQILHFFLIVIGIFFLYVTVDIGNNKSSFVLFSFCINGFLGLYWLTNALNEYSYSLSIFNAMFFFVFYVFAGLVQYYKTIPW